MSALKFLGQSLKYATELFFPRNCTGCGRLLLSSEELLCMGCGLSLPFTINCGLNDDKVAERFIGKVPFGFAAALCSFGKDSLLQHLLHELKYQHNRQPAKYLGKKLGRALMAAKIADMPDVIAPVPLHRKKQADRGYNQSELIAQHVASVTNLPMSTGNLMRLRNTETQTAKSRLSRAQNMQDAFGLQDRDAFANKHVLILDDVLTTGATMEACARAVLKAPGARVSFAAVAETAD